MPQQQTYRCPNCNEEITQLNYSVPIRTYATEYGNYDLDNGDHHQAELNNNDSEWEEDPQYNCPECDEEVDKDEILNQSPNRTTRADRLNQLVNDLNSPTQNQEPEIIIKESAQKIIANSPSWYTPGQGIICHKCKTEIALNNEEPENARNQHDVKETHINCPKCNTIIRIDQKLIIKM